MPQPFSLRQSLSNPSRFYKFFFLIFILASGSFVLFSRVIGSGISHDEYQFVASSQVLASQGQLPYVDYPFLHMPYQIPVNSIAVFLSSYHLFAIRGLNSLFDLISILILFSLVTQIFKERPPFFAGLAGALSVALYLFDPAFLNMGGRALNHALPILLSILAYVSFQQGIVRKRPALFIFLSGILIGLATGVRLSFAVLAIPFLLVIAFFPGCRPLQQRVKFILSFAAGLVLALLPVGLLVFKAPASFFFGNYVYIRLNTIYRQEVLFQDSMTLLSKAGYFVENILIHPASLVLYIGLALTSLYLAVKLVKSNHRDSPMLALSILLSLVLLASGFAPTPLWPQYFFAPVPFIIISVFTGLSAVQKGLYRWLALTGIAAAAIIGFPLQQTIDQMAVVKDPAQWVPVQAHRFGEQVQAIVPPGKVVTLAPIYPLEAGLETYSPFIVGPFVWRTAPLLSAEGRKQYQLTSFHELEAMLKSNPPSAIITGFETDYGFDAYHFGELEKPFMDYANKHHYVPYKTWKPDFWPSNITVWVRQN